MAFRDLVRNHLYGKPGKRDFTAADLPGNRVALFGHVLNIRLGRMIGMNLLYLLFWLPAAGWSLLNGLQLMNLASTLPAREVWAALQQALYNYLLILFPLIALTGPFNAAMSDVFRRWARDESFFPLATFRAALRANWRQGLLFGLLDGILPLLIFLSGRFYLALVEQSPVFLIPIILLVAVVALWLMAAPLMPLLIVSFAANSRYITQVRELFFNDAGWPMIAPTRYVPGAQERAEVRLEGKFKLLRHERDVNLTEHVSVAAEFGADGSIAGDAGGSFEAGEDGRIALRVDGVDYSGRCYVGYDETQDAFVTCITVLSADGEALWAMRATGQD